MSNHVFEGEPSPLKVIRQAIDVIEQAPAEALYAKLLQTLPQTGLEADLQGAADVSRNIAFAYKLTVELGAKLGLLSAEHLAWRRQLAAALFGQHETADLNV